MNEKAIKVWIQAVYDFRRERKVNPEGEFDSHGRWYPSDREDCGGDVHSVSGPTKSWPYSYMLRARTRQHARALVRAALAGADVPPDVWCRCPARARFMLGTPVGIVRDWVLEGCPM